jgi:hypothetical protein
LRRERVEPKILPSLQNKDNFAPVAPLQNARIILYLFYISINIVRKDNRCYKHKKYQCLFRTIQAVRPAGRRSAGRCTSNQTQAGAEEDGIWHSNHTAGAEQQLRRLHGIACRKQAYCTQKHAEIRWQQKNRKSVLLYFIIKSAIMSLIMFSQV